MPSGRIPRHFIETLLARVDVVEVIDARITLKKVGRDHMACCPFHDEKTPSFSVSGSKQFYHCFGCGASGDAIAFLMAYENLHFVDAIAVLAESVELEVPCGRSVARTHDETRPLHEALEKAALFYRQRLRSAPAAIDYLKAQGLDGRSAKRFGIGYAPTDADELRRAMPTLRRELLAAGLLIAREGGEAPQGRFSDRVVFPIHDRRGRVIAFVGRALGDAVPRWLGSPETALFREDRALYGLPEAQHAAREEGTVLVVERYVDVVVLSHHGIGNAVAAVGMTVAREHVETLYRIASNVVFCIEKDRCRQTVSTRMLEAILPALGDRRDVHFVPLADGETAASLVRAGGSEGFRERLVDGRLTLVDVLLQCLLEEVDDVEANEQRARFAERAKRLVAILPRGLYRRLVARQLGQRLMEKGLSTP